MDAPPTTRLVRAFGDRNGRGQAALIPYVTAGYPDAETTRAVLDGMPGAGVDIVELGVPFSDPVADGPTIQASSYRALQGGMSVRGCLDLLSGFRARHDTPVVLFTYLNPVLRFGAEEFLGAARDAGANGLLLTDLPQGADPALEDRVRESGLALIRLVAPTTPPDRVEAIARDAEGFLYYISRTGVTGARQSLPEGLAAEVRALRAACDVPVAVGFGISTPDQARAVSSSADGVVVGSALIKTLESQGVDGALAFLHSLRHGMDQEG